MRRKGAAVFAVMTSLAAATTAHAVTVRDSTPVLAKFFAGQWACRGGTPTGRTLDSDVSFAPALGGRWIQSEHTDRAPGRYQSLGLWPLDSMARPAWMTVYDNFGGARRFFGTWTADSITWVRDTTERGARMESFTYRRSSADTYWYAWHVRRPDGGMALGDSSTCTRKKG